MKIIALDHFRPGFGVASIKPELLKREIAHTWRLWKTGVIREIYGRPDAPSGVIVFECSTVDEVKACLEDFPLSKAGFIEWECIPLTAPLMLAALFDATAASADG